LSAEHFAARLKELREAAGLSQKELAKLMGLSQQAIALWENGQRDPSWPKAVALAEALGVDVGEFLRKPGEAPPRGRGRPPKPGGEGDRPKGRGNK